jgi:outer membrane protein OmpA-like peptidoglycan-associated protein
MRKVLAATAFLAVAVVGLPACATKNFVKAQVSDVNNKVETLSRSVEETQERTRANEGRITDVDQKALAAQTSALRAHDAAGAADLKASKAGAKADEIDKASKRLVYTVVLSDEEGNFQFGKTALPDQAKAKIDELVNQLKANPQGAYFEIEGHTDAIGSKVWNDKLGLERAEAVKRYLYEQHQIPLHKINVISYGREKPVAPNTPKAARAQNRRIVNKVPA